MAPSRAGGRRPSDGINGRDHRRHQQNHYQPRDEPPHPPPPPTPVRAGPHPGYITSSNQYTCERKIRHLLKENGCDPAREDNYRLQGVQLIDNVREHLQLPVRTFDTACVYFHKFRLNFRDAEYNYQDAALASLFVACKVEDTIKKSREILAAAYNIKNPDKPAAADDKVFEASSRIIIGLERLILETIGFDFRTRHPQKLLVKCTRSILGRDSPSARDFFSTAYAMSIDLYKTFAPIKRTTFSMVMAVIELTARAIDVSSTDPDHSQLLPEVRRFSDLKPDYCRPAVLETMLDLLDLYVQHPKSTKLGPRFDMNHFMDIKILLNNDLDHASLPRFLYSCPECESSPFSVSSPDQHSPAQHQPPPNTTLLSSDHAAGPNPLGGTGPRPVRGDGSTMRFVFNPEAARSEQRTVDDFFREEWEEHEIEVDEPIPPPPHPPRNIRDDGGNERERGGGGRRRYQGGHHNRDRWGGGGHPYRGGGGGGDRGDRPHRGRGRHH